MDGPLAAVSPEGLKSASLGTGESTMQVSSIDPDLSVGENVANSLKEEVLEKETKVSSEKESTSTPSYKKPPSLTSPPKTSPDALKNMTLKPKDSIATRNRVVSLDRREVLSVGDLYQDDLENNDFRSSSSSDTDGPTDMMRQSKQQKRDFRIQSPLDLPVHRRRRNVAEVASSESEDLDTKSSDTSDEASYFSGQLPSPKSATRKGYGNSNSPFQYPRKNSGGYQMSSGQQPYIPPTNMAPLPNYRLATTGDRKLWQESDASLSFSCSSDEQDFDDVAPGKRTVDLQHQSQFPKHHLAHNHQNMFPTTNTLTTVDDIDNMADQRHMNNASNEGAGPPLAVSLNTSTNRSGTAHSESNGHEHQHTRDISALTTSFRSILEVQDNSSISACGTDDTDDAYSTTDSTHSTFQDDLKHPSLSNDFPKPIGLNQEQTNIWQQGAASAANAHTRTKLNTNRTYQNEKGFRQTSDTSIPLRNDNQLTPSSSSTLRMAHIFHSSTTQNSFAEEEVETDESLNWKVDHHNTNNQLMGIASGALDPGSYTGNDTRSGKIESHMNKKKQRSYKKETTGAPNESTSVNNRQLSQQMRDGTKKRSILPSSSSKDESEIAQVQGGFTVYFNRWIMLFYMSLLNLLSDWTCYSVAPIAVLTNEAFGEVDPELLVTVFLSANAVATALEPIILSRLGLRRTVIFGSLLLMIGSAVKSGGIPLIMGTSLQKGHSGWRVYLGFFLVGLSQPLYQCTPALLSASWFPEKERTLATGVALNSNQLGIGCAFVFGTMLVTTSDDIPKYFGVLSFISTITFVGCALQFADAPPTPPSNTARVMRGTVEINIPSIQNIRSMISGLRLSSGNISSLGKTEKKEVDPIIPPETKQIHTYAEKSSTKSRKTSRRKQRSKETDPRNTSAVASSRHKRRNHGSRTASSENGFRTGPVDMNHPSHGSGNESTHSAVLAILEMEQEAALNGSIAPSPMLSRNAAPGPPEEDFSHRQYAHHRNPRIRSRPNHSYQRQNIPHNVHDPYSQGYVYNPQGGGHVPVMPEYTPYYQNRIHNDSNTSLNDTDMTPDSPFPYLQNQALGQHKLHYRNPPIVGHEPVLTNSQGYGTMNEQWQMYQQYPPYGAQYAPAHIQQANQMGYHYYNQQSFVSPHEAYQFNARLSQYKLPAVEDPMYEGAEPVLVQAGDHLNIDIRDDQILLSLRACFSRPGFMQSLIAFVVSAIVINTLSTFMDYLVRLGGSGGEMVGIVGGSFQLLIMCSSLLFGQITDKTRAYFSVILVLLVFGAFALAECGVNLDAERGTDLKWSLIIVAVLVGPLQPVATELGVEVAFPLSENTVLVIQQLFANLLSAFFIPCFKAVQNIGRTNAIEQEMHVRPQYTFSFYLLIVIHACATVAFATFNGHYLRLAHELEEKEKEYNKEGSKAYHGSDGISEHSSRSGQIIV